MFFFHTIFLRDSICLHFKFLRCNTEAIFKVKVKLVLKMWTISIVKCTNAKISNLQKCKQMFFNIILLIGAMWNNTLKSYPNQPRGKLRFWVKSKMAVIMPVVYAFFSIFLELHIVEPHILCIFALFFLGFYLFTSQIPMKSNTHVIFKVKVKLDLKYK